MNINRFLCAGLAVGALLVGGVAPVALADNSTPAHGATTQHHVKKRHHGHGNKTHALLHRLRGGEGQRSQQCLRSRVHRGHRFGQVQGGCARVHRAFRLGKRQKRGLWQRPSPQRLLRKHLEVAQKHEQPQSPSRSPLASSSRMVFKCAPVGAPTALRFRQRQERGLRQRPSLPRSLRKHLEAGRRHKQPQSPSPLASSSRLVLKCATVGAPTAVAVAVAVAISIG
jgi:hypothetical protein